MDEVIQLYEVIHQQHLNILLIHLIPQLIQVNQILAQDNSPDPKLVLILDLCLLDNQLPLHRLDAELMRVWLGDVIDVRGREVVSQRGFEDEGGIAVGPLVGEDVTV